MTTATEKFEVRNRWTNAVQFTAEITCAPDASVSLKLGLAVEWARKNGANLSDADLSGANLSDADLIGASLIGANLSYASLRYASLRPFKADMWLTLATARNEVPALISALKDGRVDGSQYEGGCACLVGTLANASGSPYATQFPDCNASNPAEQWFSMIRKGDKPGDDTGGGFAAGKALEWAEQFQAAFGEVAA